MGLFLFSVKTVWKPNGQFKLLKQTPPGVPNSPRVYSPNNIKEEVLRFRQLGD